MNFSAVELVTAAAIDGFGDTKRTSTMLDIRIGATKVLPLTMPVAIWNRLVRESAFRSVTSFGR